ncbi:hypothetical protein EUGRSUZ_G03127 [Eucalyptus grandis]|uniref:Uncharacterized protein n=2 Tax=Eucalyptus grandis TaxID=71139 RepID=A0ACC3K9S1_EUCGR|nr:hypothetical protein EUGRSUZ_G03127 [Eucalyptus grandis]
MAVSCKSHILLMIVLAVWQPLSVASAARPLTRVVQLPPTSSDREPASALNLALPRRGDTVEVVVIPADRATELGTIVSCEETGLRSSSGSTASFRSRRGRRSRTFGPMFLNFLPKGSAPPSGPSKGTNGAHN